MLKLNNVEIFQQDCGNVIGIFLQGKKEDVEQRHWSFWNRGATEGELDFWNDDADNACALFWIHGSGKEGVAQEKLFWSMADGALAEILNSGENTKKTNPMPRAQKIAEERIALMERVNWYKPIKVDIEFYSMGVVKAE